MFGFSSLLCAIRKGKLKLFLFFNTDTSPLFTYAWRNHSLIVVGVDTHAVTLEVKCKLAVFDMLQFVFMQVRPSPQSGIDYMREAFTSCHLKTTTWRKGNSKFNCKGSVNKTGVKCSVNSIIKH